MRVCFSLLLLTGLMACDDDDGGGSEAQSAGVGDECRTSDDCLQHPDEEDLELSCLSFKGGYCGAVGCAADVDCPAGSACVSHDGAQYCFLVCANKVECNLRRPVDAEANCIASADFTDDKNGRKVCVPPSGGE